AASGLGGLLVRWAKHAAAHVIGTASTEQKAELARAYGEDHVIVGRNADIVAEVSSLTDGRGVDYAIDGIGGGMLKKTFDCVRKFGTVASIGQAADPIPMIAVEEIGPIRSLNFARPSVMAYAADPERYRTAGEAV